VPRQVRGRSESWGGGFGGLTVTTTFRCTVARSLPSTSERIPGKRIHSAPYAILRVSRPAPGAFQTRRQDRTRARLRSVRRKVTGRFAAVSVLPAPSRRQLFPVAGRLMRTAAKHTGGPVRCGSSRRLRAGRAQPNWDSRLPEDSGEASADGEEGKSGSKAPHRRGRRTGYREQCDRRRGPDEFCRKDSRVTEPFSPSRVHRAQKRHPAGSW